MSKRFGRSSIIIWVRVLQGLLFALSVLGPFANSETLTVSRATLIDISTGEVRRDTTIVIEGNRIASVGRSRKTNPGVGKIIDARGLFVIPGLWDMHTHVYFGRLSADGTDLILPLFLANGITGIRDMGSDLDHVLHARDEIAAGRLFGPRMIVAGPMLDAPKSGYRDAIAVATPDDGRRAVAMLKSRGVDFIKVQSGIPRKAYFAIAEESKKLGVAFEGHVPDAIRAAEAVSAGQRSIEHSTGIFEASSTDEDKYLRGEKKGPAAFLRTYDPAREAVIIQLLAEKQVWQCPTLFWERGGTLVDAIDYSKSPDLTYACRTWVTQLWPLWTKNLLKTLDTDPLPVREKFIAHELNVIQRLHTGNVPFLAGTDTPTGVNLIPGVSLHLELQRFVAAGFTPLEALQTATLNPAKFYNRLNDYGPIQTGRIADLVLLKANPLDAIGNTRLISGVIADGRYISPQALEQLRSKLKHLATTK